MTFHSSMNTQKNDGMMLVSAKDRAGKGRPLALHPVRAEVLIRKYVRAEGHFPMKHMESIAKPAGQINGPIIKCVYMHIYMYITYTRANHLGILPS